MCLKVEDSIDNTCMHTFQLFMDGCPFSIADFQGSVYLQSKKAKNLQKGEKMAYLKTSICKLKKTEIFEWAQFTAILGL